MKTGDIVKTDDWAWGGRIGMIVQVQNVDYCKGAYVLFYDGVRLVRLGNLKVISECR